MKTQYDAIVVGAGPAGLACGTVLAQKGLDIALLDEQSSPGGQIYRNVTVSSKKQRQVLGSDYLYGLNLLEAFEKETIDYLPGSRVWQVGANGDVCFSRNGASAKFSAPHVVLCTGAMERPVPFPGWTLPGVMTCGAISNLFKDSGLIPADPVVLAGSGPFLWLVAEHLFKLNAPVMAILDTSSVKQLVPALRHVGGAVRSMGFMMKGVRLIGDVYRTAMKRKVPIIRNVQKLEAEGSEHLELVRAKKGDKVLEYQARTLLVSEGIIPNTSLQRQVGCTHSWDGVQRYHHPVVSTNGETNLSTIFVAGDGGFVHGAKAAEFKGRMTALHIAKEMRRITKGEYEKQAVPVRQQLDEELRPRPFVDSMYAPRNGLYSMSDETIVCRCEGVTAGRIRSLVREGFIDHNEIKAIIRCGMGPCQGRMCSSAVLEIIADVSGKDAAKLRQHRLRPPIKPVSLQELANAATAENAGLGEEQ